MKLRRRNRGNLETLKTQRVCICLQSMPASRLLPPLSFVLLVVMLLCIRIREPASVWGNGPLRHTCTRADISELSLTRSEITLQIKERGLKVMTFRLTLCCIRLQSRTAVQHSSLDLLWHFDASCLQRIYNHD